MAINLKPGWAGRWRSSPSVREHLRPFLRWLLPRHADLGGITEIRLLRKGTDRGIWSGYFGPSDTETLISLLDPLSDVPRPRILRSAHPRVGEANIYFSLGAVTPELATNRRRRLVRARSTTRDTDIHATTLFIVDIDPERDPRDCAATSVEKACAIHVTDRVQAWLGERGVESIRADSGNGFHLLVPLVTAEGERVREASKDARDLLRLLDQRFSTPQAKVDTSTFNPSRILKLYGTLAIKGEHSAERPHRFASINLSGIPDDVDLFTVVADDLERFRRPPLPKLAPSHRSMDWQGWRRQAVEVVSLEEIYGDLLTGQASGEGWLQCRDPRSPSGDKNPSAGVADGSGQAERGSFHSFRTGETVSIFDFLVISGRAADFKGARDLVAELTGLPTPSNEPPEPKPDNVIAELKGAWSQLNEDERRDRLRAAIAALLRLRASRRKPHLQALRGISGMEDRTFDVLVAEVRRTIPAANARATMPIKRPVVEYVVNRDTVAHLFDLLVDAVAPAQRFFRTEQEMVFIRHGLGPLTVSDRNIGGLLSTLVELRFSKVTDEGIAFTRYGVLPGELARAFVADQRVRGRLPHLLLYCRSPLFDTQWRFIGRPGYHPDARIYYDGPALQPASGLMLTDEILEDFHWKDEADRVGFIGALITAITMPHWGRGHPFLAINGNKPGVGKSTLARVLGVIVEGHTPHSLTFTKDDAELEKQLATRVEAGDRVILIDNAKTRGTIASAVLERTITDTRLSYRRLGSNTAITRPTNDLLVCITMNLTQMGADLRRRALPVNLELGEQVQAVRYKKGDLVGVVLRRRMEVVAELAGMVKSWLDGGRKVIGEPASHSTSQVWAQTIGAILAWSALPGFLSNFEASTHAFDPRFHLMLDICAANRHRPASKASEWAAWLGEILEDRFMDRRGQARSARARATIVGRLFIEYLDAIFVLEDRQYRLQQEYPEGHSRPPTYRFQQVFGEPPGSLTS